MRSVPWITLYVGMFIGAGYFLGTGVRWRLHAAFSGTIQHAGADGPLDATREADLEPGRVDPVLVVGALEALAAVGWSLFVLWITDVFAPGSTTFRDSSAVGFLSSQTLTAWESAALWSGLAVICGLAFPAPLRIDRGSPGLAAAAGLLLVHLPLAGFVATGAFFAAQLVRGRQRWSWTIAILTLPGIEWVLSMLKIGPSWGLVHGPETALWMMVLAGLLAARRGRSTWDDKPRSIA